MYNPGGLSCKRVDDRFDSAIVCRIHYSAPDKLKIVATVNKMMSEEQLRQNQACDILQVCDSQVLRWRANRASLEEAARPMQMSMHEGPVGCMDSFTEELVSFVDEWRGMGILVSCLCLIQKATNLSPVFANTTLSTQKVAISRFMAKNGLVHCMATHTVQRPPPRNVQQGKRFPPGDRSHRQQ